MNIEATYNETTGAIETTDDRVSRIWQHGGGSLNPTNGKMSHAVTVEMKDGSRMMFFQVDDGGSFKPQHLKVVGAFLKTYEEVK